MVENTCWNWEKWCTFNALLSQILPRFVDGVNVRCIIQYLPYYVKEVLFHCFMKTNPTRPLSTFSRQESFCPTSFACLGTLFVCEFVLLLLFQHILHIVSSATIANLNPTVYSIRAFKERRQGWNTRKTSFWLGVIELSWILDSCSSRHIEKAQGQHLYQGQGSESLIKWFTFASILLLHDGLNVFFY